MFRRGLRRAGQAYTMLELQPQTRQLSVVRQLPGAVNPPIASAFASWSARRDLCLGMGIRGVRIVPTCGK